MIMKFPYHRYDAKPSAAFPIRHSSLKPCILTVVHNKQHPEKLVQIWAMIDSGADVSIIPGEICDVLGLKLDNGKEEMISGINKETIQTFLHDIVLEIGGWHFETQALFSKDETCFPVLGQLGFFDCFKVSLDYSKEEIELKSCRKPIKIENN
jgi:hypothetical protein